MPTDYHCVCKAGANRIKHSAATVSADYGVSFKSGNPLCMFYRHYILIRLLFIHQLRYLRIFTGSPLDVLNLLITEKIERVIRIC